jgi:outer membrane protein TolC
MFREIVLAACVLLAESRALADDIPSPLTREAVERLAAEHHPALRAAREHARAIDRQADAEGKLPSPELDFELWQVPFSKPYALDEAGMLMLGFRQRFPAPGSQAMNADAMRAEARATLRGTEQTERDVRKRAAHAFADYVEAFERVRIHGTHVGLAGRMREAALARYKAGGQLSEIAQSDVEVARVQTEHEEAKSRIESARARLDIFFGRPANAPLPDPAVPDPLVPAWDVERLAEEGARVRSEVTVAKEKRDAAESKRAAAKREWLLPGFSVAALYFAPVGPVPAQRQNGFGLSLAIELPWLWGGGAQKTDAAAIERDANALDVEAARVDTSFEVAVAHGEARAHAIHLRMLTDRVLPAAKRALDAAWPGYESNRVELMQLLVAQRSLVDAELEIVVTRAALEHAMIDLDAAVGKEVPRVPLGSMP